MRCAGYGNDLARHCGGEGVLGCDMLTRRVYTVRFVCAVIVAFGSDDGEGGMWRTACNDVAMKGKMASAHGNSPIGYQLEIVTVHCSPSF